MILSALEIKFARKSKLIKINVLLLFMMRIRSGLFKSFYSPPPPPSLIFFKNSTISSLRSSSSSKVLLLLFCTDSSLFPFLSSAELRLAAPEVCL